MITLGGIDLGEGLVWQDEFSFNPVLQAIDYPLEANTQIVTQETKTIGKPFTLQATNDYGWLTRVQVEAIQALASQVNATFTLDWWGDIHTVMFRHHEPPAFQAEPIQYINNNQTPSEYYYRATIKLFSV